MRRTIWTVAAGVALVVPMLAGSPAASSAGTTRDLGLPTSVELTAIYPDLENERPIRGNWGVSAHDFARVKGRLKCDHYRDYRGVARRGAYFSHNITNSKLIEISVDAVRFRTENEAQAVVRHYRKFARVCRGTHRTTDGEGGSATMKVRRWRLAPIGDASAGMLDAFIQYGDTVWRRTVVARVGRTVSVVVVAPPNGVGSEARALELAQLAVVRAGS